MDKKTKVKIEKLTEKAKRALFDLEQALIYTEGNSAHMQIHSWRVLLHQAIKPLIST